MFTAVALGDLDADGDLDAVTPNENMMMQTNFVWRNVGGVFSNRNDDFGWGIFHDAAIGDLNGDGVLDVFLAADGSNTVWFGQAPLSLDLALWKTVSTNTLSDGSNLSYTVAVTNLGGTTAGGVEVEDTLPDGVSFVSSVPPPAGCAGGVCTYAVGTLGPGAGTAISIDVTVDVTTTGTVMNSASVSHSGPDPNPANSSATADTVVTDNDADGDPDFHDPDDDNDGMTDEWENDHNLNPTNPSDATGNPDEDPHINREEFVADTDPADSNDYLRITGITKVSPVTVWFDSSSSNRDYRLQGAGDLVGGSWSNVPGAGPRPGAGGADSLQDTNEPPRGPFYRLEVTLP